MKRQWENSFLLEEAGDGTGGSGGSLLTSASNDGGGSAAAKGGADSGSGADSSGGGKGSSSAGAPAKGQPAQDWRLALPPELQEDASLKSITDISSLAKSYVHAQKLIGADKIPVPSKHATEDDWKAVYHKLGLPKKAEDYQLTVKEGSIIEKEFAEKFKEAAFNSNILPAQAQKMLEWVESVTNESLQTSQKAAKEKLESEINGLKKEWGEGFNKNITLAKKALAKFADKETVEYLEKSGLGNDIRLVKLLQKVGETLKEDSVPGSSEGLPGGYTPKEAMAAYSKIIADIKHPYHIKDHPNHRAALEEVQNLFKAAHSS